MSTIVEYTDTKIPCNRYPRQIVSPVRSGACCFSHTEEIGLPEQDDHWIFRYKRCRVCGFTVRLVSQAVPDQALLASLRKTLSAAFQRKNSQY